MNIVLSKLVTEKSARLEAGFVYMFEVATDATKYQISQTIENLYGKKPLAVRTMSRSGKRKRTGKTRSMHVEQNRKLAYVTMKEALVQIAQSN